MPEETGVWATARPFVFGGLSGMTATSCIQPIDTVKVRIQILGEAGTGSTNPITIARDILAKEGPASFYKGLDSALFRQATYGTARLGIYKAIFDHQIKKNGSVGFMEKVGISWFAGATACLIGNPADLALVRFQSDATLPEAERRNYKHVFDAFGRIIKEEGFMALYTGLGPTVSRAIAMNVGMLSTFDQAKEMLNNAKGTKDQMSTRLQASAIAGVACSFMSLPFDNVKTKLQKMKAGPNGLYPYAGVVDCLKQTIAKETITGLWIGLPTYYVRVAPHAMITLTIQDVLHHNFGAKNH